MRGQIRVRCFGDGPENLLGASEVFLADPERGQADPQPERFEIEGGGTGRVGEARLALRGIGDREAAQALRGRWVLTEADLLEPLPEGEFYWYQLLGCRVEVAGGEAVGTVREIWDGGAHDVLVVRGEDGRDRLIPTARELMREVDLEQNRIVVTDLPGLLDPV